MNSKITFYYLHKSGASEKIRYTANMYKPNRSILVQDDENSIIWILHGPKTHSETIRLENYGIDEINLMLKYKVVRTEHDELENTLNMIVAFFKNSKDKEADTFLKSKIGDASGVKLKKMDKPSVDIETRSIKPTSAEARTELKKVPKSPPKSKPKTTEAQQIRAHGLSSIPAPPSTIEKDNEPIEFVLKADIQTGPLIDDFNIAYYEKSGGGNFVLVEELDGSFGSEHFEKLSDFVKLVNKLKLEKSSRTQAKASLNAEYNNLIDILF